MLPRRHGRPVGCVLAHTHPRADDTWPTGPAFGEIESLAVAPENRGVGTTLLDVTEQHFAENSVHDIKLSVVNGEQRFGQDQT